jgi:hypothetical protein
MIKKGIIILLFLISSINLMGQGFTYSYADPCTSKISEIYIDNPNGNTALFYGGQTQSFTSAQLQSGAVQQWINQVNSSNPSGPCSGVGLAQNVTINSTIASNNISVLTSVLSTLSSITSVAATTVTSTVSSVGGASLGGIVQADEKVTDNNNNSSGDDNNNDNNGTTNNTNGNKTTSGGNQGQNNVQTNQTSTQQVGGNNSSQGTTAGSSNSSTTGGEQTSQSSVTSTQQVPTNNPPSNGGSSTGNPVSSGNQTNSQSVGNQGNNSVSSNSPATSGNNSTANTNNSTTPNTNNSTSVGNNQNSQTQGQNNQNSPVVSENHVPQGQNNVGNTQNSNATTNQGQSVSDNSSSNGGGTLSGGANAVKTDTNEKNEKQEQAKEEAKSVQSSSAQSSSSTKSKVAAVKQGSVMMTGDIVTISSASGTDPTQVKINSSIIMSNTKNTFAKGALINFTSSVNNSNITLFMSFRKKRLTTIFANSTMMNFQKDLFNTTSIMESYQYHKITGTAGINLTTGNIGESKFQSISTLAGLIGTFKVNKSFGMTTMFVMVYSPYVFYYEGMWNKSGYIAVPFVAIDYKLSKKFKLNVSFSGVNQINDKTLNYQVLLGAKAFL